MKIRLIYCLLAVSLLACNKEEEASCKVSSFSPEVNGGIVSIFVSSDGGSGIYELEYGSNGFSQGSGTKDTISNGDQVHNLSPGIHDFYIRANCDGTEWSEWVGPKSVLLN